MSRNREQSNPVIEQLKRLDSSEHEEAWSGFLEVYTPRILQIIRIQEQNEDNAKDCYVFVCEQLRQNRYQRLRRYCPESGASFNTWLSVVVRNLIIDWRRRIAGRKRSLSAIDQLPRLDQEVFHFVFEQGLPLQETLFHLYPKFPSLTETAISETIQRIKERLTPRQLRILQLRKTRHDLNYEMLSQNSVSLKTCHNLGFL